MPASDMAGPTLFQKILSGEVPGNFVARGGSWGSFLDAFPLSEGHTLVVPSNPVQRIADLSSTELGELFEGVKITQSQLSAYFGSSDFTIVVHDGPLAGQEIPHVHIHIIPRLEGDGGKALPSMFPESNPQNPPGFLGLSELCDRIKGASK